MTQAFRIDESPLRIADVRDLAFGRRPAVTLEIAPETRARIRAAHDRLQELMERNVPIYGVTTGFGDSCARAVPREKSEELQRNLVAYLSCGTGPRLPEAAARATLLIRLKSLSRGFSGVSLELIERMALFFERGWSPLMPRQGSLGASGDLIPLAYLARALQGEGSLFVEGNPVSSAELHARCKLEPYRLKPKEGLALVNGTSAMAGICLLNLTRSRFLTDLATLSTAWLCMALRGRTEAFGELVNAKANTHPGQSTAASRIHALLAREGYEPRRAQDLRVVSGHTEELVQNRYSLRCAPQVLGPVIETLELVSRWLEAEINGTSDNPLIDDDGGSLAMGGNFYGGYLGHGMDYLKISLAQVADLLDRQLTLLIDEKSNGGLPPNLADWPGIPEAERFLHHGLKGLHQAVNAITSETLARATPGTIFSRSSESHNQDKVSLGMSAAVQCAEMIEPLFTIQAMVLICLAQALDLRETRLQSELSRGIYRLIRETIPRVSRDRALDEAVDALADKLKQRALSREGLF